MRPHEQRLGRRAVVLGGAAGAVASSPAAAAGRGPRIVVVGAGLAGLTAAARLQRRTGWPVVVHEARDRVGGRVHTVRGLPGGLYGEAGGFISTCDRAIRGLARELRVPLIDPRRSVGRRPVDTGDVLLLPRRHDDRDRGRGGTSRARCEVAAFLRGR